MPLPRRPSLGILEAAVLLVLAAMGLRLAAPVAGARNAAAEERSALAILGALADAEDAHAAGGRAPVPYLPLDALAAARAGAADALRAGGFLPSEVSGVYGNRTYWIAVLLPGKEGWIAGPGGGDPAEAARGYAVVAWPRAGAPEVLRGLAALPGGTMWQRADGVEESGLPGRPPVPRTAFPPPGEGEERVPAPPGDWSKSRRLPLARE